MEFPKPVERVPRITEKVGKALKKRRFRLAPEFFTEGQSNAFAGPGTVPELIEWLKQFEIVLAPPHGSHHVNLEYNGELVQIQPYIGGRLKYEGLLLIVLPHTHTGD